MLEMLINPIKAEKRPWEMFFVGAIYAAVAVLLVQLVFSQDSVLSKYSGILVVTFTVMFSLPYIFYTLKIEEKKIRADSESISLLKQHEHAIFCFLWLFLGFVVAFSVAYLLLSSHESFKAQIETFCLINRPANFNECVKQYTLSDTTSPTAFATGQERLFLIFTNNMYVLVFTLVFSLLFGAGAIFVLAWNASVIAAAIGIFTNSEWGSLPLGLFRYMIHGIPEIASYFIVALAGGLVSVAVIRHEVGTDKFWEVLQDALNLIILSVIILFVAALIEVFVTGAIF